MTKINIAPVRGLQHDKLSVFIGKWHAEGHSYAAGQTPNEPRLKAETWTSDETFEWIDGKFFVLQRWQAMTGKNPFAGIGVLEIPSPRTNHWSVRCLAWTRVSLMLARQSHQARRTQQ